MLFFIITIQKHNNLRIFFIDVGQGDSTLILTPNNKSILIDGGGSEFSSYDIGENVLLPYLLDRRIKEIDYMIVSHFDSDHVGGLITILENLKVKNIIIGKQFDESENLEEFINIVNNRKIKINVIETGAKINIEKNLYFKALWPDSSNVISENSINNNALVLKLEYKINNNSNNFSMLFTGDIEEETEKLLESKYKNTDILKSDILKVGHHGSKTSSTQEFLKLVNPKVALIGVGKNNKYGHPNSDVIERLKILKCKIYRTDENGEISIIVNRKGKVKIDEFIK